jgi:HAD superfamily hydrolase (TIGR01459 family)
MSKRISGLSAVIDQYDALLVDLWGCVHNGVEPFPAAVDALRRATEAGVAVCLLSNGPRRVSAIVQRLDEMGVPRDVYKHVVTSGEATWRAISLPTDDWHKALGKRCYHLGPDRDHSVREDAGLEIVSALADADFVLNTGTYDNADVLADYEDRLQEALKHKLPMVCANPDLVVHIGDDLTICAGLIAERYLEIGGVVAYHGKPHPSVYAMCFEKLGAPAPARVLGIGDAIRTDVAGAKAAGCDALFLASGIYVDGFGTPDPAPEAVVAKAAEEGHPAPDYFMPALAW